MCPIFDDELRTHIAIQDTASVVRMLLTNNSMTGQNIIVDCVFTAQPEFGLNVLLTFLLA